MPDYVKIECPHCSQPIEAPSEMIGMEIKCPGCAKTIQIKPPSKYLRVLIITFLLLLGGLFAVSKVEDYRFRMDIEEHPEKYGQYFLTRRYEKEAEAGILKECSNYVGFTRIMDHYASTGGDQVTNWHGTAIIDFVNKVGGVERTNLIFRFLTTDNHCFAFVDDSAMWELQIKEEKRMLEYQRKILNP